MSETDPSKPLVGATGVLRARPDDASFEADFADLAARFASQTGGGLSPELSADLALEIVLNEVVEQACLATGATGAAIVLQRDGEMVCRASSGSTAPGLGARIDTDAGLSGECIKTRRTQRCDDILTDPRVDVEASQRLGVRSVMVMPLLRGEEVAGVFEAFSSRPNAFGERDERTLEALAGRILNNMERAEQPLFTPTEVPETAAAFEAMAESAPTAEVAPEAPENLPRRGADFATFDFATWGLGFAVIVCAVLLGMLLGRDFWTKKESARSHPAVAAPITAGPASANPVSVGPSSTVAESGVSSKNDSSNAAAAQEVGSGKSNVGAVPPGGLAVFENGKEVFRLPPDGTRKQPANPGQATGMQPAASIERSSVDLGRVVALSPAAAQGSLLHRVEPEYPEEAREARIQGAVVLDVHIGRDGGVQDVQLVSGPPQLAQASTDAVKQWRFKPQRVSGRPAEMQTRVTLNFRLPQ